MATKTSPDQSYKYQALQNDEIRVLTIEPLRDGEDASADIRCRLEHIRLSSLLAASPRRFKGDDRSWPETQTPLDTGVLFKSGTDPYAQGTEGVTASGIKLADSDADSDLPWRYEWGDYMALSYVWGTEKSTRPITVDGIPFAVSFNLFAALTQLRRSRRIRQGFKIWIDFLCINQSDIAERSRQVALMHRIYTSAWKVVIWLGTEGDGSDLAITALRWMAERHRSPNSLDGFYRESKKIDARPFFIKWGTYHSPLRSEVYKALFHFLTRSYWRRMWILQEVALAHEDSPVICGSSSLSCRDVREAALLIADDEGRFGNSIIESVRPRVMQTWTWVFARDRVVEDREFAPDRMWRLLKAILDIQRDQNETSCPADTAALLRLLHLAQEASITEEKDRVYGVLGIRTVASRVRIVPDYTLSLSAVYQDFAEKLLANGNLDILRLVSRHQGSVPKRMRGEDVPAALNRPALVPYLLPLLSPLESSRQPTAVGTQCDHNLPTWTVCLSCMPAPTAPLERMYRADGGVKPSPPIVSSTNPCITVRGVIFDTVTALSSFSPFETDRRFPQNTPESPSRNAYGDLEGTRTALWRTMVGDTTEHGSTQAPDSYSWLLDPTLWRQGVAGVYTNDFGLSSFMERNEELVLGGQKLKELIYGSGKSAWKWKVKTERIYNPTDEQLEALSWAMNVMAWRRLIGTGEGRIGLGPAGALAGDAVAVLLGCSTPMVLRKWNDGWHVVGESYIHGVMDGEVFNSGAVTAEIKLY